MRAEFYSDNFACGQALSEVFGTCYRIGGDEFVCLTDMSAESDARAAVKRFEELLASESGEVEYPLSAAAGFAVARYKNESLEAVVGRADKAMYEIKQQCKQSASYVNSRAH